MASSYSLNPRQFTSVSVLDGNARVQHFVARVADWEQVWSLKAESGWASAGDESGRALFPVWPHPDYAQACASGDWAGFYPEAVEVHDFIRNWLPGLDKDGLWVAVFPTPAMQGVPLAPFTLCQAIEEELSAIE